MKYGGLFLFGALMFYFLGTSVTQSVRKSDFSDYYRASVRIVNQESLYKFDVATTLKEKIKTFEEALKPENAGLLAELTTETATYIYPPLFAFLLLPLTNLSYEFASGIHSLLNWFSLLGICLILGSDLSKTGKKKVQVFLILGLSLLLNFRYIESHIQNNQIGIFLVFLVLLAVTSRSSIFAGILLSLAIVIKVTPLVFLFYFLYKKEYKTLVFTCLGILFWIGLPLTYNYDYMLVATNDWFQTVLGNALSNPVLRAWKNNQSLPATLGKYFVPNVDFINQGIFHMPYLNWDLKEVKIAQAILMIPFGVPLLILFLQKEKEKWILSLLFLFSCIFSGISWVHSFVICLVPITYLLNDVWGNKLGKWEKAILVFAFLLPLVSHRSLSGKILESVFLMFSILLYTTSTLYFYLFWRGKNKT